MTSPGAAVVKGDPYKNPELFRFVGYMEGVPEWVDPTETHEERLARGPSQERLYELLEMTGTLLPGIGIALGLAILGRGVAEWAGTSLLGFEKTPFSPIVLAILVGLLIRNAVGLPRVYEVGLARSA
jgi:hypothetical protein